MRTVAIIGFGIVGKSYARFFREQYAHATIVVWDQRELSRDEYALCDDYGLEVAGVASKECSDLCDRADTIALSPGFDVRPFACYREKLVCELSLFSRSLAQKSIAITGTLGKTSVTAILTTLFHLLGSRDTVAAGNIGYPLLDCAREWDTARNLVLELSSFQLALNPDFSPRGAIVTALHPNHIDVHGSFKAYIKAKKNLLAHLLPSSWALLPASLLLDLPGGVAFVPRGFQAQLVVFSDVPLVHGDMLRVFAQASQIVYLDGNELILHQRNERVRVLCNIGRRPSISFSVNWLLALTALHLNGYDAALAMQKVATSHDAFVLQPHRLERFCVMGEITFYDDSKSTTPWATLKALSELARQDRGGIVILGGLSKGVDRAFLYDAIMRMPGIRTVMCFGNECATFPSAAAFSSLEAAVAATLHIARPGDYVLFSPSGASFDLFENYHVRGERFKQIVRTYESKHTTKSVS